MQIEIERPESLRQRDLPPETEVHEVIERLCEKCEFNPLTHRVKLTYVGGDRRRFFHHKGIKLMRACPFTVQLYIGCKDDTVETHFQLLNSEKRAMIGNDLYHVMERIFDGRVYIMDSTKEKHNAEDQKIETLSVIDTTETNPPSTPTIDDPESTSKDEEGEADQDPVYKKYFDDPKHVHLVICALVVLCNESTTELFSFDLFEQALVEADVPKTTGPGIAMLRPFLARGFVTRVNPEGKPARYNLTQQAIDCARSTLESIPAKPKRPYIPHPRPEKEAKGPRETILQLKKIQEEHNVTLEQLRTARAKLEKLKEVNTEDEETRAQGEIDNLNKRLRQLEELLEGLNKRRSDIALTEATIKKLIEKSENPKVKEALAQLDEFRKLLE